MAGCKTDFLCILQKKKKDIHHTVVSTVLLSYFSWCRERETGQMKTLNIIEFPCKLCWNISLYHPNSFSSCRSPSFGCHLWRLWRFFSCRCSKFCLNLQVSLEVILKSLFGLIYSVHVVWEIFVVRRRTRIAQLKFSTFLKAFVCYGALTWPPPYKCL